MKTQGRSLLRPLGASLLLVGLGLIGCSEQHPTTPDISGISAAKGGNGGKGDDPTVTGVDPTSAPQDTTLDVRVFGSGYERGSKVVFERGGVAAEKVTTNSTRFVSSGELVANVTIALDAETGLYDVAVFASGRRKGIGAELFTVKLKGRPNFGPAIEIEFEDLIGYNIRSDGRGIYVDRECGVSATFNLEDARLDPEATKIHQKEKATCGGRDSRFVTVEYAERLAGTSGRPEKDGTVREANFMIVESVETVMQSNPPALRDATIHGAGCGLGLRFTETDALSNQVEVRNLSGTPDGPWTIATQPTTGGERRDVAVCITSGGNPPPLTYWHMPFQITVRLR